MYVSLNMVVMLPPRTIFLFEVALTLFLINATGIKAKHKTTTPTNASFQEL